MRRPDTTRFFPILLSLLLLAGGSVFAQEAVIEEEEDPPQQVARLSFVEGEVQLIDGEKGESQAASLNLPLTGGDELRVGRDARAELQLRVATLRIDEGSRLSVLDLAEDVVHLRLGEGVMVVNVREGEAGQIEVETPNARITLLQAGEYRLSVEDGGIATVVGVRDGESEIASGSQLFALHENQEGRYTGMDSLDEDVRTLGSRDDFEQWADERDVVEERSVSSRYVSREVIGYSDLDRYGYWASESMYGPVWYPRYVTAGWAPYRFGSWAWVGPWGWTWVDRSPWGFAPFHYGRWASVRSRWCWVPGPRHARPVYAPALVKWHGSGRDMTWQPLGPREIYVPRHRASERYVRDVNLSNARINNPHNIVQTYRNNTQGRNINIRQERPRVDRDVRVVSTPSLAPRRPTSRDVIKLRDRDGGESRITRSGDRNVSSRTQPGRTPRNVEIPSRTVPSGAVPSGSVPSRSVSSPRTISSREVTERNVPSRENRQIYERRTNVPSSSVRNPREVRERPNEVTRSNPSNNSSYRSQPQPAPRQSEPVRRESRDYSRPSQPAQPVQSASPPRSRPDRDNRNR